MKALWLKRDYRERTVGVEGQFPDPSHLRQTLDEDTKVIGPDGTINAVLVCNAIPPSLHKLAFKLWKAVDELPSNRGTAVGSPSLPRVRSDGTLGVRRAVPKNVLQILKVRHVAQGTLGSLDRTPDQPCHRTPLSIHRPELLDGNKPLIELVDKLYRQHAPTFYAKQRSVIEQATRWRLWKTVFSTIYIAKNFRTAYHFDSGNLPGVMSALMPMGKFTGGELVLPHWRIAIAFKPGDLLLFDPQQLHGNLPFFGERLSAVFYCERRIAECGK